MPKSFYFSYAGGKNKELHEITGNGDVIPAEVDKVVEPFCGSSALSFALFKKQSFQQFRFILNDNDEILINFLNDVRKMVHKNISISARKIGSLKQQRRNFKKLSKATLLILGSLKESIRIREGIYPSDHRNFNFDHKDYPEIDKFYQSDRVEITCSDYKIILDKFKDDPNALLFLDPPYFLSCNKFYQRKGKTFNGDALQTDEFHDQLKHFWTFECTSNIQMQNYFGFE